MRARACDRKTVTILVQFEWCGVEAVALCLCWAAAFRDCIAQKQLAGPGDARGGVEVHVAGDLARLAGVKRAALRRQIGHP